MTNEYPTHAVCDVCGGPHPTGEHTDAPPAPETVEAHIDDRVASVHALAIEPLEEAVEQDARSVDELLRQFEHAREKRDYTSQREIVAAMRRQLDLAELKGRERSPAALESLSAAYLSDNYSDIRNAVLVEHLPTSDPDMLFEVLRDQKFSQRHALLERIDDPAVCRRLFESCKTHDLPESAVDIVALATERAQKVSLFEDLSRWLANNHSKEAADVQSEYGSFSRLARELAGHLAKHDRAQLGRLMRLDMLNLEGLEDQLREAPTSELNELLSLTHSLEDAARIMKWMTLEALRDVERTLADSALPQDQRESVLDMARRLAHAFEAPPRLHGLGALIQSKPGGFGIPNKFILALREGDDRATIAWSNTGDFGEHKNLARRIGEVFKPLCTGGMIEVVKPDEGQTLKVVFSGRSGTYGPYNRTFLEGFTQAIQDRLAADLGEEVEVDIQESGMY